MTSDELELISDGKGLAIIGDPAAIDRFLSSEGLTSKELALPRLGATLGSGGAAVQAASQISENSGRWVQLTKESAQTVQKLGLRESSKSGLSTGVIKGNKGQIAGFVEFAQGPGSVLTNPALLAGAAGVMSQMAMQQTINEITDYLATIDEKVDDILRAQKDAVLADMIGVEVIIDEAMTIRDHVGHVSDVTWSKVQGSSSTIARTQLYALRQLDGLAAKLESKSDLGELASATEEARAKAGEWLAVIARCFQLHDALGVLEIDRVLQSGPDEIDRHRLGLSAAREKRLDVIGQSTMRLLARMDAAAAEANEKVLTHPWKAPAIVESTAVVTGSIVEFRRRLSISTDSQSTTARRWTEAAVDARDKTIGTATQVTESALDAALTAKNRAVGAGAGGVGAAKKLGNGARDTARSISAKTAESRPRRRRKD